MISRHHSPNSNGTGLDNKHNRSWVVPDGLRVEEDLSHQYLMNSQSTNQITLSFYTKSVQTVVCRLA